MCKGQKTIKSVTSFTTGTAIVSISFNTVCIL